MPIDDVRIPTHNGAGRKVMPKNRHTTFWDDAFKRERTRRMRPKALLHAGIEIRQIAHFAVSGKGVVVARLRNALRTACSTCAASSVGSP